MSLFDSISIGVATKYGAVSLSGGKIGVDMGAGLVPATPTPLTPAQPNPGSTGAMAWIKANPKTTAGIVGGLILAIFLARR
jgi:hypothetical protein